MSAMNSSEELNKLISSSYIKKDVNSFVRISGCTVYKEIKDNIKEIEELEVYDDDIWVVTFPRSGTTWTQELVWCICNKFEKIDVNIDERFPHLEFNILGIHEPVNEILQHIKKLSRPRFIKSHLPWNLLPKQIRNFEKRPKIIHVSRDPKDVCVSYYHHQKNFHGFNNNLKTFCTLFTNNKVLWTPLFGHIESYLQHKNEPNMLFIKYEDMKTNLFQIIEEVSFFLEVKLSEEEISNLIQHLDFNKMKNNSSVNRDKLSKDLGTGGNFMRKGEIGSYKSEMDEETFKLFEDYLKGASDTIKNWFNLDN